MVTAFARPYAQGAGDTRSADGVLPRDVAGSCQRGRPSPAAIRKAGKNAAERCACPGSGPGAERRAARPPRKSDRGDPGANAAAPGERGGDAPAWRRPRNSLTPRCDFRRLSRRRARGEKRDRADPKACLQEAGGPEGTDRRQDCRKRGGDAGEGEEHGRAVRPERELAHQLVRRLVARLQELQRRHDNREHRDARERQDAARARAHRARICQANIAWAMNPPVNPRVRTHGRAIVYASTCTMRDQK